MKLGRGLFPEKQDRGLILKPLLIPDLQDPTEAAFFWQALADFEYNQLAGSPMDNQCPLLASFLPTDVVEQRFHAIETELL